MKRLALIGGVVAAAGVAALVWWRVDHAGARGAAMPAAGSSTVPGPAPVAIPTGVPVRSPPPRPVPVAPPAPPPSGPGAPAAAFEDEPRDPAWAADHEREATLRLRALADDLEERGVKVEIGPIDCRRARCRIALAAPDNAALGKLYDALESEQGLVGWADTMLLDQVDTAADGRVSTRVVAQFTRDD